MLQRALRGRVRKPVLPTLMVVVVVVVDVEQKAGGRRFGCRPAVDGSSTSDERK